MEYRLPQFIGTDLKRNMEYRLPQFIGTDLKRNMEYRLPQFIGTDLKRGQIVGRNGIQIATVYLYGFKKGTDRR